MTRSIPTNAVKGFLMAGIDGPPLGDRTVNGIHYQTLGFPCASPKGPLWNCGVYMAMPEAEVAPPTRNRQVGTAMKQIPYWLAPLVQALSRQRKRSLTMLWNWNRLKIVQGRLSKMVYLTGQLYAYLCLVQLCVVAKSAR
jgi:hypothetical protein